VLGYIGINGYGPPIEGYTWEKICRHLRYK
jgi:hypothetical protein